DAISRPGKPAGAALPSTAVSATPAVVSQERKTYVASQTDVMTRGFEEYKAQLILRARKEGIREATIQAYIPTLRLSGRAIELDRAQKPVASTNFVPEPLGPYLREHVTPTLIARGQARYYNQWPRLLQIYAKYGVDPAVVMAIYGKETSYGSVTGNFDLLNALSSLAFEGRRREMFETEFISTLKLIDSGVSRDRLKGSYAGATGFPQFMPSVVVRLRADGDGDSFADIWTNEADALASIANYLREAGWKAGVPWGAAVRIPDGFNRDAVRSQEVAVRCPAVFRRHSRWLPVAQWKSLGVLPVKQAIPDAEPAALMEPDGPTGTGYLITSNYKAILDYNCSNFYAMSIGLLSDAVARR
ncbi:MAG: lytic murein transglycosylase, partial [Chloroflexia bacterium]